LMTYSIASESLGGGVCFQACLLVCKGLAPTVGKRALSVAFIRPFVRRVHSE